MNELQAILDQAFNLMCDIMVKGCDVEKLADTKMYIRQAFQLASNIKEVQEDGGQDNRRAKTAHCAAEHESDPG